MRIKGKNLWKRVLRWFAWKFALALVSLLSVLAYIPRGFCATSDSMTDALTEWLPIILQFAIIGMMFGMLKKLGRW